MRILLIILLLLPAISWGADVTLDPVGAYGLTGTVKLPSAFPSAVGATGEVSTVTVAGGALLTGVSATVGVYPIEAIGTVSTIFGNGVTAGVSRLRTLNARLSPLRVVKTGLGSLLVTGNGINCGTDCETEIPKGQSTTLTWSRDTGETDLLSWGNACQHAERRTTCTIPADSAGQLMYTESDGYMVASLVMGNFANPICRTGRNTSTVSLYPSIQGAYNSIAAGTAYNPIDCIEIAGDGPLSMTLPVNVVIVGGWADFMPGQMGSVGTRITGGLIVVDGSLTIGDSAGGSVIVQ